MKKEIFLATALATAPNILSADETPGTIQVPVYNGETLIYENIPAERSVTLPVKNPDGTITYKPVRVMADNCLGGVGPEMERGDMAGNCYYR